MNTAETDTLKLRIRFPEIKTNIELWNSLHELLSNYRETIPVRRGVVPLTDLNNCKSQARLFCTYGSANIHNYNTYTVDVYECKDNHGNPIIYQELKTADLQRFGRRYNGTDWSEFAPLDDQCHLEAKVIRGTLFLRHGFLPPYAKIIVLRKKRRDKNAGYGRHNRSTKCAWCHAYKIELSKGEPNTWYVPKCVASDALEFTHAVGKEFAPLMSELLFKQKPGKPWRISGVNKSWRQSPASAYAKLAIAIVQSHTHNVANTEMLRIKFRVWRTLNGIKKGLSVE